MYIIYVVVESCIWRQRQWDSLNAQCIYQHGVPLDVKPNDCIFLTITAEDFNETPVKY